MTEVLLITPPFTQLNTPYPATAYLKGFLNTRGISSHQMDLGIEVILELFSSAGLKRLFEEVEFNSDWSDNVQRIYSLRSDYLKTIDQVMSFLQGHNPTFARQICTEEFLPEASRFETLDELDWAFGSMGFQDKAKHLATLYLEDLSDFIVECVDPHFGFSRYAERLGRSANSFDELHAHLQEAPTYIDEITLDLLQKKIAEVDPELVCFSVPFPGNLYSAFRCAQYIKEHYPQIKTAMGGGFPNTELRDLKEVRVFDYFDFITLDDGERPVEQLVEQVVRVDVELSDFLKTHPSPSLEKGGLTGLSSTSKKDNWSLKRTFYLKDGQVYYDNSCPLPDFKQSEVGTPDYSDLPLDRYISVIEVANPMHSLWSDGRWNKLTMAHGCYWAKCTFCDVSLDYIKLYEPIATKTLVDRMEELIAQTGERGFHFVDEAAPPALMREVALEIIRRKLTVTWWTNIRFEKSFTMDLCKLLQASGCIAVSGGLEVASDRLLALIDKGVTVEQVARVTRNFTESGIMVHAYLMYGYPTQTVQETIDSLEMVRQLFELNIVQSGFWHQFALTAHSPVGLDPEAYGVIPDVKEISFANNDVQFRDKTGVNHDRFSFGLKKSLFNFMHGLGFEMPLREWFDFKIPATSIPPSFIENALYEEEFISPKASSKIVWLGGLPQKSIIPGKKGRPDQLELLFHQKKDVLTIRLDQRSGEWLVNQLEQLANGQMITSYGKFKADYEAAIGDFEPFWYSKGMQQLRGGGLLVV
ncbi:MAG: radical SAM protein [Flammeovirgaceae bacterium]|nr:radical SAM protein [Flammeovirgaceae bacterium]MBE61280.1 radical SAM protein [Flammeovirgaceae bacterium]HCX23110.1 radical SAM protein [Cytophagales bacterium]